MFGRSSFQIGRRSHNIVQNDSTPFVRPKILSWDGRKHQLSDRSPATLEACAWELERVGELQQKCVREMDFLAERQKTLTSRIQEIVRGQRLSQGQDVENCPRRRGWEVEPEKSTFLKPGEVAENFSARLSRCLADELKPPMLDFDENKMPLLKEGPRTSEGYRGSDRRPELAEVRSKSIGHLGNFQWETVRLQSTLCEDTYSSPLITTLKKLKWQYRDFQHIKRWCKTLAKLFYETDEDGSGMIEEDEFSKMIDQLPLSEKLKEALRGQFKDIDLDNSGGISLVEFLYFFLQYKPFKVELSDNVDNQPYHGKHHLSRLQRTRLFIFKVITKANFNAFSKGLYCVDFALTLVPVIMLFIYALSPSLEKTLLWDEDLYMWIVSIFFAGQWVLGLALCKSRTVFLSSHYHILELISFLPYIIYKGAGYTKGDITVNSFVLCRFLRVFQLSYIFPSTFAALREQIDIYENTLILAYTSYRAMAVFMLFINLFLSMLIFAFERGEYSEDLNVWIRSGESKESPFSNFFNCFYFTIVTGTTLGYGDMSPISYVGKLIALFTVAIGLINITFVINTIGDCFEEVFRGFLLERTKQLEEERSEFIRENVDLAQKKIENLNKKKKRGGTIELLKTNKCEDGNTSL